MYKVIYPGSGEIGIMNMDSLPPMSDFLCHIRHALHFLQTWFYCRFTKRGPDVQLVWLITVQIAALRSTVLKKKTKKKSTVLSFKHVSGLEPKILYICP